MEKSILEIQREHGLAMRKIALEHVLEIAKIYRNYGKTLDDLVEHLEEKLVEEAAENG